MIDLVATTSLRWVDREDSGGTEVRQVLQQRVKATEGAGTSKERSYYVWLDVEGPAYKARETADEAEARKRLEDEARKSASTWVGAHGGS